MENGKNEDYHINDWAISSTHHIFGRNFCIFMPKRLCSDIQSSRQTVGLQENINGDISGI
jgi:hypothetical protein